MYEFEMLLVLLILSPYLTLVHTQIVLLPDEHVADPFKDNPKWNRFKLEQRERLDELKVLVDNVYNLLEDVQNPSPDYDFKDTFIKFQFQAFADFFNEAELKIHTQSVYPTMYTAIGKRNLTALSLGSDDSTSETASLNKLRVKWIQLQGMADLLHKIYRETAAKIFSTEPDQIAEIFNAISGEHSIWIPTGSEGNGTAKLVTGKDLAELLDSDIVEGSEGEGGHVLRGLVKLLQHLEQTNVDVNERLNFFCYGNNWFGVLPDLIDIISNAALHLTTADMKKLVLDLYQQTYSVFYGGVGGDKVSKEDVLSQRQRAWDELVKQVDHVVNFTYLDGTGWKLADGPIIFKCDLPPTAGHEWYRQWGRNITTGAKPNASAILENNPQAGPFRPDETLGYYDDRTPEMNFVAFQQTYQGYIESELVLNPHANCVGTCDDYHACSSPLCTNTDHCPLLKSLHCSSDNSDCLQKNCRLAKNCIRAAQLVQMCSSNETGKMYDWIKLNDKVVTRQNVTFSEECNTPGSKLTTAIERWDMENGVILAAPVYCELCLCTCVEPTNEDEQDYFDLQEVATDVANGYIISSLKFVKHGHVIRLAVEQGVPLVNGDIDELSVKWVDLPAVDMKNPNKTCPLGGRGFTKLNFNMLVGEPGTVLTGIRFVVDQSKALNLEIQVTPITWSDEQKPLSPASLVEAKSVWILTSVASGDKVDNSRQPLVFQKPLNNPTQQRGPSMPDVVLNSFVEFATTSYETDLGQSIVPYFDSQSIHFFDGRSWLRGLGIMHKGRPQSTGFIVPIVAAAKPNAIMKYLVKTEE